MTERRHDLAGHRSWWLAAGLVLLVLQGLIVWQSPQFQLERGLTGLPVLAFTSVLTLAAIVFVLLPSLIRRSSCDRWLLVWIVILGAVYRLAMFASTPILEDDFYRYLWDGAVVGEGINPYRYSPLAAFDGEGPASLSELARTTPLILERVNHPHLKTIYPPVAQASFAVAHWLKPWSLTVWRAILLAADSVTLILLFALLASLGRSPLWVVVYWWNPLVVKELFNSAHVDALLLPLMLGALLLSIRGRALSACGCLALAVGVKLWPVLLLPAILKAADDRLRIRMMGAGLFAALVGVQSVPILSGGLGGDSGFAIYSRSWEMNDAAFMMVAWASNAV